MLKKRLLGVVTVLNGWAVQSFGYKRYLPLGRPEPLVENLDRWGADEILVQVIDRSRSGLGPDFALLERLARLGLSTPLIYAGGVRTVDDGVQVVQRGADRVSVDGLFQDDLGVVADLGQRLGTQAVIASLPVSTGPHGLELFDYRTRQRRPLAGDLVDALTGGIVSEAMLIDWIHEGSPNAFSEQMLDLFPVKTVALIAFGGISTPEQMASLFARPKVDAVAIGNFLTYREHAIQHFRRGVASAAVRPASYASEYSLIRDV